MIRREAFRVCSSSSSRSSRAAVTSGGSQVSPLLTPRRTSTRCLMPAEGRTHPRTPARTVAAMRSASVWSLITTTARPGHAVRSPSSSWGRTPLPSSPTRTTSTSPRATAPSVHWYVVCVITTSMSDQLRSTDSSVSAQIRWGCRRATTQDASTRLRRSGHLPTARRLPSPFLRTATAWSRECTPSLAKMAWMWLRTVVWADAQSSHDLGRCRARLPRQPRTTRSWVVSVLEHRHLRRHTGSLGATEPSQQRLVDSTVALGSPSQRLDDPVQSLILADVSGEAELVRLEHRCADPAKR